MAVIIKLIFIKIYPEKKYENLSFTAGSLEEYEF